MKGLGLLKILNEMFILNFNFSILWSVFSLLQKEKNKEQEEEEEIGEDSQFMKLAKKVTAKSLQKKGKLTFYWSDNQVRERKLKFQSSLVVSIEAGHRSENSSV